jgi:RNA polymerase sigma factor (sigma-70 family)
VATTWRETGCWTFIAMTFAAWSTRDWIAGCAFVSTRRTSFRTRSSTRGGGWTITWKVVRCRFSHGFTRRRHVLSQRRDITRELSDIRLADDSSPTALEYLFADDSGPERHLDRQELEEQLQEAIHSLPSKDREVLLMRYFDQRGFAEIADTLCITRGAVKARLVRALIRLRGVLELAD